MKLLHLDSSIQGNASVSRIVSAAVAKPRRADNADLDVSYRDLVAAPIKHLTMTALGDAEAQMLVDEFLAAGIVVIGAALYNFTISSQLKAWVDRIVMTGRTFGCVENEAEGLAGGRRVIVALARGGLYSEGSPITKDEHAETLLRTIFAFIGIDDAQFIFAEGLALGEEPCGAAIGLALKQVGQIAYARRQA